MNAPVAILILTALSACASTYAVNPAIASSTDFADSEMVEVKLSNFDFTPSEIYLKAGVPYSLRIVNEASGGHDFTAPEFFGSARVAPDDVALVSNGQIDLKAGTFATVHLVPAAGTYDLVCTHAGHAFLGMKGKIVVSQALGSE
jgi:plastocyanin